MGLGATEMWTNVSHPFGDRTYVTCTTAMGVALPLDFGRAHPCTWC